MELITGHCTGKNAHNKLVTILEDHLKVFYSGAIYSL